MPDKKSSGDKEEKKGGPMKLVTSGLIAVVLLGAGYVIGGKLGGAAPAAADGEAAAVEEEEAEPAIGKLVALDAVNVNLAEGRYLRVAVTLGVSVDYHAPEAGGGHGGGEEVEFPIAPASDAVLSTFSGRNMAELSTAEGREAARLELLAGLEPYYHSDIVTVYFTEFVMQ